MTVKRKPEYKQDNPRDQLKTILGAAHGHIHNCRASNFKSEELQKAINLIVEAQKIIDQLEPGKWKS